MGFFTKCFIILVLIACFPAVAVLILVGGCLYAFLEAFLS